MTTRIFTIDGGARFIQSNDPALAGYNAPVEQQEGDQPVALCPLPDCGVRLRLRDTFGDQLTGSEWTDHTAIEHRP